MIPASDTGHLAAEWREALADIRACTRCAGSLPNPPNPVLQGGSTARIILISQAPGNRAHQASRPFADPSGNRLRAWLGLSPEMFYDATRLAIMPMAFCYPGAAGGGDRPPPPICAATWHARLLALMPQLELTLLIGRSAQIGYQTGHRGEAGNLTETVSGARMCRDAVIPLPHPSWHNNSWLARNPWFEDEMLPRLRRRVAGLMHAAVHPGTGDSPTGNPTTRGTCR